MMVGSGRYRVLAAIGGNVQTKKASAPLKLIGPRWQPPERLWSLQARTQFRVRFSACAHERCVGLFMPRAWLAHALTMAGLRR